jgi:hypothetical protein
MKFKPSSTRLSIIIKSVKLYQRRLSVSGPWLPSFCRPSSSMFGHICPSLPSALVLTSSNIQAWTNVTLQLLFNDAKGDAPALNDSAIGSMLLLPSTRF